MSDPLVTVLLPNYKTPDLTKICLRLLRKHTNPDAMRILVIDNDSKDESTEYLRSLPWIVLIERKVTEPEPPTLSHSRALDLGLEQVTTPYVLSIHTDTFVHHPDWLPFLIGEIDLKDNIAGVGSWKLEVKPLLKRWAKTLEYKVQSFTFPIISKGYMHLEGKGDNFYYLRSHCALYRMDLIRKMKLTFSDGEETAGKIMHKKLVDNHYEMVFLPSETMTRYIYHVNHATMVLHPELGSRKRSVKSGAKRIEKMLNLVNAKAILNDTSLDR